MKTLITGANGLVGQALCSALDQTGYETIRAVRTQLTAKDTQVGEINRNTQWETVLSSGIDAVVHLAAHLPSLDTPLADQGNIFHEVNTAGTINLARQCAQHGVKRFIFVSTVKVLGENRDQPYSADDLALPVDAYAISKWEAEQALWEIAAETGMEVVVLRPPLVYGPGVKGNLLSLIQAIDQRKPLPLGAIQNKRSLIYVGNLVDVIRLCLEHPNAAGKTYVVSDGEDISTPELVRRIAQALGRKPFLVSLPVFWIQWAGKLLSKTATVDRLLGSLTVDITPLKNELGWQAPYTIEAGLAQTAQWYRTSQVKK